MVKRNVNKYEPPSFETIKAAVSGEVCAINTVLKHYSRYILYLSNRIYTDLSGAIHMEIDTEMKSRMETKLITGILKFRIS